MHVHHKIKESNHNFKGILIEIGTIIFAVLFALGVESLWEHHNTNKMVDLSIEKVNKEVENNLYEFAATQRSSKIKFNNLLAIESSIKNDVPFSTLVAKFNGYNSVNMQNSVWKRVLNDRVSAYFPSDYLEESFKIYEVYGALELLKTSLLQFVFSDLFNNKEKSREAFEITRLYYQELNRHCENSIEDHLNFLKKHDAAHFSFIKAKCDSFRFFQPKDSLKVKSDSLKSAK